MSARLTCPMCNAPGAVAPRGDGDVVACSACGQQFKAVAPKPVAPDPIPKAAAPKTNAPPPLPPVPKKVDPVPLSRLPPPPPVRHRAAVERDDDEDETSDEVSVRPGPPTGLIIGAGAALLVFFLAVIGAVVFFTSRGSSDKPDTEPVVPVVGGPPKAETKAAPRKTERRPLPPAELAKLGRAASAYVEGQVGREVGSGSAFCVQKDGLFVTNHHVIENVRNDVVRLVLNPTTAGQRDIGARVVKRDPANDLALLQAPGNDFVALELGETDKLSELQAVVAFGYPFGRMLATEGYPAVTVSEVKISSLRRRGGALHLIQLNGALNPGNSGGPVLDETGAVIGVVVKGIPGSGLADAIPSSVVLKFLTDPEPPPQNPGFRPRK